MFGDLLKGLIDSEKLITDKIQDTLMNLSEELGVTHKDLFVMIKPVDAECNFKLWVYRIEGGKPTVVREILLTEILET